MFTIKLSEEFFKEKKLFSKIKKAGAGKRYKDMEQKERKSRFLDEKEKKEKQREIMAIKDRQERIKAIARNKDLFR